MRTEGEVLEANFASVKGTVGCDRVAEREVELRTERGHLRGRCPLPDHGGDSPSFYCYSSQGNGFFDSWYCHRCGTGGDVVDLWREQEGPFGNSVFAMQDLAEKFGLKLWREEDFYDDKDLARKRAERRTKKALDDAWARWYFDLYVVPEAEAIGDPSERKRFLDRALKTAGLAS